jgi:hypothetical protein
LAAWSSAQVESEPNLNLLVTNDLLMPPGADHGNDIVFRNRIGGVCITARADYMVLNRIDNHSFTLLSNGRGGSEALNASDLVFEARTGPKLNLIVHKILFGGDLELGYMRVDGFSLSKTTWSDGSPLVFESPFMTATANNGTGITFDYHSRFSSAEANLRFSLGNKLSLLGGFRYIDLHEQIDGSFSAAGQSDTQFITSNTDNHLYGGQLGAELAIINTKKIVVAGIAKAGMFGNQADLTLYGANGDPGVGRIKGQMAFLGEVDLVGSYLLSDNIAVRLGYQALWLQGVALAPDQFNVAGDANGPAWYPDTKGSLFYHGAFLGLEISF